METLEEVNQDPEFREYMSMEEDAIKMENSRINAGIEKGIKQGIEKGIEQGINQNKKEIAKALLENNIDIDIISKSTGLSIEEINNL